MKCGNERGEYFIVTNAMSNMNCIESHHVHLKQENTNFYCV